MKAPTISDVLSETGEAEETDQEQTENAGHQGPSHSGPGVTPVLLAMLSGI